MPRLATIVIALLTTLGTLAQVVPQQSVVLDVDQHVMRQRLTRTGLQPIEGIWQYQAEDMTVAIERYDGERDLEYRIIMLASDDISVIPGTVIGYIAPSAIDNKYRLWIYCEQDDSTLLHPVECVATIDEAGQNITFQDSKWELRFNVNFMRFMPTLFRGVSVIAHKNEENLPLGFSKVYPHTDNDTKNTIIYL